MLNLSLSDAEKTFEANCIEGNYLKWYFFSIFGFEFYEFCMSALKMVGQAFIWFWLRLSSMPSVSSSICTLLWWSEIQKKERLWFQFIDITNRPPTHRTNRLIKHSFAWVCVSQPVIQANSSSFLLSHSIDLHRLTTIHREYCCLLTVPATRVTSRGALQHCYH